MKPIEQIRSELRQIPKSMWEEVSNPFDRPRFDRYRRETVTREDDSKVFIEGEKVEQYPDFLEQELLQQRDREIGIDSQQGMGIDALSWYISFHVSDGFWGIFIPTSSLLYLELRHFKSLRLSQNTKKQVAINLLLEHELFHFATDCACAQWEILLAAPCWRAITQSRLDKGLAYVELEEALANAHMLRTFESQWSKPVQETVRKFVDLQPPGYDQARCYLHTAAFDNGLVELIRTYIGLHATERKLNVFSTSIDYGSLFPFPPNTPSSQCPVHIIHDLGPLGIPDVSVRFFKCIPEIIETVAFQKLFSQVPHDIQKRWQRKKEQLKHMLPQHPEFENFRDYFSLRLGHSFRVHLRPVSGHNHWEAFEIGPHTKMGHG